MDDVAPRLDRWLWFARLAKTRAQAQALCAEGCVRLNGETVRRGQRRVRPGDRIEVFRDPAWRFVTVLALADRRLGAAAAQALYAESRSPLKLAPGDDRPIRAAYPSTAPAGRSPDLPEAAPRNDFFD